MQKNRKDAKQFIKSATRQQYDDIVHAAFLTIRQEKILFLKRARDMANWQIGNELNVSVDTVNHELLTIYDKVANALKL